MVITGDLLSGCLVVIASLFMNFDFTLKIELKTKGKK